MNTISTIRQLAGPGQSRSTFGGRLSVMLTSGMSRLELMMQRHRTRRVLLALTDEQLKDIGLSRVDARREGLRPFWD